MGKTAAAMRVLFASGIDGFCHRYGVLHWAEQLATQGIASTAWAHTDPRLAADLATHDVLVLYRVPDVAVDPASAGARRGARPSDRLRGRRSDRRPRARRRPAAARARATTSDGSGTTASGATGARSKRLRRVPRDHRADRRRRARARHADARAALRRVGRRARARSRGARRPHASRDRPVRLGYFSGTATHDDDLATIAPALAALLDRHPQVELLLVGPRGAAAGARAVRARASCAGRSCPGPSCPRSSRPAPRAWHRSPGSIPSSPPRAR